MSAQPTPSKTSLSASKVTELKALCSKHGLTVSGNKSELISRLAAYFETVQTSSIPQVPANKDLVPSSTSTPATHSTPSKPPPVDNKTAPPQKDNPPVATVQSSTPQNVNSNQTHQEAKTVPETSLEDPVKLEIEKRKQRAQKFGLAEPQNGGTEKIPDEDEIKRLNRAKRFGISDETNAALDKPLADGKAPPAATIKSTADLEWEDRKRKRAEKFGLVDNPPVSNNKNPALHRKNQKFNDHRPRY